ncbi:MAG: PaaI family thioesterase [Treponema sp.]|nr:PaaI family thioesterase [Treponema sp.]
MEYTETIETIVQNNPFMRYNHICAGNVKRDAAETYLDITKESLNIYGMVHGGALYTVADCCAGMTARTDGRTYVTQSSAVQFIRNVHEGRITARGKIMHRGKYTAIVNVIITDERDTLLFSSTFTMFCTSNA